jgi:hypothetical protein
MQSKGKFGFSARTLTAASFLLVTLAVANYPAHAHSLDSSGVRAVPPYDHCVTQSKPITRLVYTNPTTVCR